MRAYGKLLLVGAFFLNGSGSSLSISPKSQLELDALVRRGYTYRFLPDEVIELTDPFTGEKRLKSLREPDEAEIRAWAAGRGIPILEIDPNTIDTTRYTGWYSFFASVPLSSASGVPVVVGDLNGNNRMEIYGSYHDSTSDHMTKAYEVDSTGNVAELYTYLPRPGVARQVTDADRDGLMEVVFTLAGNAYDYEQATPTAIPTDLEFVHNRHWSGLDPGFTGVFLGDLDADSLVDFLYKGSEADSSGDPRNGIEKIYVAEFNHDSSNFVRVWSTRFVPGAQSGIAGFAVDDFDRDGREEFVVSDLFSGKVFVVENTCDNAYHLTWTDSTGLNNVYHLGSGDVDGDGPPEFFIGATMSSGNWTVVYEATGDNAFSPVLIFHILSAGIFDNPFYLTSDVDGDGGLELIIFSGADLYMFKARENDTYSLWFYKRVPYREAICIYDFNLDDRKDLVINKSFVDPLGRLYFYTDLYTANPVVSVSESTPSISSSSLTFEAFPNPSHSTFQISSLPTLQRRLIFEVYSVTGQLLFSQTLGEGTNSQTPVRWDASGYASGVYLLRLSDGKDQVVRKVVLLGHWGGH
ncbi:MAG: T9SS type A sorting domain-containing protein [Bacteroidota bacterium]